MEKREKVCVAIEEIWCAGHICVLTVYTWVHVKTSMEGQSHARTSYTIPITEAPFAVNYVRTYIYVAVNFMY